MQILLDFSERAVGKLDEIVIKAGVKNRAIAIRNAIKLYKWYLEELSKGSKIVLKRDDTYTEIDIIL
jgi:metal-responsive CopG/Arc/MetJ family transcriptional regulator